MFTITIESDKAIIRLVVSEEIWKDNNDIILSQITHTVNDIIKSPIVEPENRLTQYKHLFGDSYE